MTASDQLSDAFVEWLDSHQRDEETPEETMRRLLRGPAPDASSEVIPRAETPPEY